MLIIGIAGGSGSGKTTVVKKMVNSLPEGSVTVIPQDAYYRDNSHLTPEERTKINFDHPGSIEFALLNKQVDQLLANETIQMPTYNYVTCSRGKETIEVKPSRVMIIEGILVMTNRKLRDKMDVKVFVDADADDRLMRNIRRDMEERGRSYIETLEHYQTWVKPMHQTFIEPTKKYADVIVPQGGKNHVAIDILATKINQSLHEVD
ncbi:MULTISPECIES: uridine kinase [unclassified Lentimicrobium]|uniref:uridine kinase n=1 Tax=unclassified Lentimicrobium TaxID=2677434 RepID=UPI0015544248|nr:MULTISPECIES: uridine kinase [unclassified Lentimicrobium]NPD44580.1 uridine kinase [Lentimicrobium sp. S6]NPD83292.1 uridine kinase [Lentimicrobium sp. L6]